MALKWSNKDPNEVLDYVMEWDERLDVGDEITSSIWFFAVENDSPGLQIDSDDFVNSPPYTVAWLSGGTLGVTYQLTNRITTAGGRTMDQTVKVKIKSK